jgi:hypothetical protein
MRAAPWRSGTVSRLRLRGLLSGWSVIHQKRQSCQPRRPAATACDGFATRLTAFDCLKSLARPGTREGLFRVVYRFENEQLLEIINRTPHAGPLSALLETENAYGFYFAVYGYSVGRFTPIYMALINPFRRLNSLSVTPPQCRSDMGPNLRLDLTSELSSSSQSVYYLLQQLSS